MTTWTTPVEEAHWDSPQSPPIKTAVAPAPPWATTVRRQVSRPQQQDYFIAINIFSPTWLTEYERD